MARIEKQYAVEILERYSHGHYGKTYYFGMYVPGFSKKDAEEVAIEMLSEMTFDEITKRCVDENPLSKPWTFWGDYPHWIGKPIGLENADRFFSCKAYIE